MSNYEDSKRPLEPENDYILRATAFGGQIRAFIGRTTGVVETARQQHLTAPTATAALGRTLTAALLLALDLQDGNSLTVRVMGDGPLGGIVVTADAQGGVRGYVQEPQVHLPAQKNKLDVGGAVGQQGLFSISKDLGLKEPYSGSAPLVSGEIAEDLTYYLALSEQIPSMTALGVLVDVDGRVLAAGGYIIQVLPGASEEIIRFLEERQSKHESLSTLFHRGLTPEQVLAEVIGAEGEIKYLDRRNAAFICSCSRERLLSLLASLGKAELEEILKEQGEAEIRCHFCNTQYLFSEGEIQSLLSIA